MEELGVKAIAISCNILKDEDMVHLVDTTVKELGGIQNADQLYQSVG